MNGIDNLQSFCFTDGTFWFIFDSMNNTVATNIRIDKDLKKQATELFNDMGLSLSGAITLFLKQSVLQDGLPFRPRREKPKAPLDKAIEEAEQLENDPNAKTYATPQELWDELGV